ncbi:MAG: lipoprotein [Desulfuromonadales bacterium]
MKKTLLLAAIVAAVALSACGQKSPGQAGPSGEAGSIPVVTSTGPAKTRAEVLAELADFKAACKADPKLAGCGVGEAAGSGSSPVVGTAKTRAEVSAELAAFLAACKVTKTDGCPGTNGGQ